MKAALLQPARIVTHDPFADYARRQEATVEILRAYLERATLAKLADLSRKDKPDDSSGVAGH